MQLLFDNFNLFSEAPNGIQKLRELILYLAAYGKLVPQDPEDEPAICLVGYIQSETKKTIKDISREEAPYVLPNGWIWVRIGEFFNTSTGGTPSRSNLSYWNGDIPWLKSGELNDNRKINKTEEYITEEGFQKSSAKIFKKGSLVIALYGATAGMLGILDMNTTTNQAICNFETNRYVDTHYLFYYLRSIRKKIIKDCFGGAQPNISQSYLKKQLFPVAPHEEQKRIVAKVDQLMALCDELEKQKEKRDQNRINLNNAALNKLVSAKEATEFQEHWNRIVDNFDLLYEEPENVKQLKQAILQLAVQGKLVPQNLNDEPASELLERIKNEKQKLIEEGKIKKEKPLPPILEEEIPYELPKGWVWERFGNMMYCYRGHNPPKHEFIHEPRDGYVRFIQITDFKTDKKAVYVPRSRKLKYIFKDEIIMAAYRHIGKLSRDMEGAFNVALCKIMEVFPMSRDFIEKLIGTSLVKGELLKESGRAHIPSMHTEHLRSLIVPLPPLNEQKRIVAKADALLKLCDQLEAQLEQSKQDSEKLMDAVLQEAFSGNAKY